MLAHLWNTAPDRAAVAAAANKIDIALRRNPLAEGESRLKGRRVMFVEPLGVHFEVREDDRLVQVLKVWRIE